MKQEPHPPEKDSSGHTHAHEHGAALGGRAEIILSLLCGALLLSGWLLDRTMDDSSR
ncbi:hypothetical protein [Ahniella affigens]|uniref:hypothetical protein n=1 Tax=Ahniella affigens TaxID=2021234 RepID=UPI001F0CBBB2|nr:hypothetical protein [Ahniella affigens]